MSSRTRIPYTLEIACFSIESAILAQKSGADRIELCDNPAEGGTTPSYGILKEVRKHLKIPVYPMIRPRGGHFVYTDLEIAAMKEDIILCKKLGFEGVVLGLLLPEGTVNIQDTKMLVELAYPMDVTFHRAFDRTMDAFEALEDIIKTGCTRILTSGQKPDVNDASDLVNQLIQKAAGRIGILAGSGVRSSSVGLLAKETGAFEFHASARTQLNEPYPLPASMNETLSKTEVDPIEVTLIKKELAHYFDSIG